MGMGVVVAGAAMGSPAGVADAGLASRLGGGERGAQIFELAGGFAHLKIAVGSNDSDAGRIVAAILQALEAIHQDGGGVFGADISHDSAHLRHLTLLFVPPSAAACTRRSPAGFARDLARVTVAPTLEAPR